MSVYKKVQNVYLHRLSVPPSPLKRDRRRPTIPVKNQPAAPKDANDE